jgi:hypothetical protein
MNGDDSDTDILKRRKVATEVSPYDVKQLALKHGLTEGQIRGLLLRHGNDAETLAAEAMKLRHQ